MRTFFVRWKDLSHVPFQYYVNIDGTSRPLDKGYTSTFAIIPPKDDLDVVHVHIVDAFARELENRWNITEPDFVRVAAKAAEAWLKGDPIPPSHFYGPSMLKVDAGWYPRKPDGSPEMAGNPYNFMVETAEPWLSITEWNPDRQAVGAHTPPAGQRTEPHPSIVFGFTTDVCPALLILGYEQFRKRARERGLEIAVTLAALNNLPPNIHTLFVPAELSQAAYRCAPGARVIALEGLINNPIFDTVIQALASEWAQTTGDALARA